MLTTILQTASLNTPPAPPSGPGSITELTGKKLKIWSSLPGGAVLVVQDGTATDPDATTKVDDGFAEGWNYGLPDGYEWFDGASRMTFDLRSLQNSRGGVQEFTFAIQDFTNINSTNIQPGDRVEFACHFGPEAIIPGGAWPSWHSADPSHTGQQTIVFYGMVDEVNRVSRQGNVSEFEIRCVDPITYSNRINVFRSGPDGIDIPWVIFNVDRQDDPDRFIAIKKIDPSEGNPLGRFGVYNQRDPKDFLMTLGEVLEYLQYAYQSALFDRGVVDGASDLIFDAGDLAALDDVIPKTVFENQGFGEVVRALVRANIPDHEIVADPRSKRWRLRATHRDVLSGGFGTMTQAPGAVTEPYGETIFVGTTAIANFSTTGDGSSVRLQAQDDLRKSEVRNIVAVDEEAGAFLIDWPLGWTYTTGDLAIPMYAESTRVPRVGIDLHEARENNLQVDLTGVYTAVNIVGRQEKTERKTITRTVPAGTSYDIVKAQVVPAYDPSYEDEYNFTGHRNRRTDKGPNGDGIEIDEIETVSGAGGDYTRIYFSEDQSAYGNEHHVVSNVAGEAEWTGTAFVILTAEGQTVDIEAARITGIVNFFARAGWMDSPTNSIRRFRIDLDRDILAQVTDLEDVVNDASSTPDLFMLSSSESFKPRNPNKRWAVGRFWRVDSTTLDDENQGLDTSGCPGLIEYPSTYNPGHYVQQPALPVEQTTEAPRTFDELVDYFDLNPSNPLSGGVPRAWFIEPPEPPPSFEELCAQLPPPPPPPVTFTFNLNRFEQNIRSARVPSSGFEGLAWWWHNHAEELYLTTDSFEDESQTDQFLVMAAAIWRRVSSPHYTGSITLNGLREWLPLFDLGFRVTFGSGATGFAGGVVTEQSRFWGLVQSIRFDLKEFSTSISFDNSSSSDSINQALFERQFVSETAELKALKAQVKALEESHRCAQARPPAVPFQQHVNGCDVAQGSVSASAKASVVNPKNAFIGGASVSVSVPFSLYSPVSPNNTQGTHSFNPPWVLEQNHDGGLFAVQNPTGAVFHVDLDPGGTTATIDDTSAAETANIPAQNQDAIENILGSGLTGATTEHADAGVPCVTDSGSTVGVIQLANAIPNDGRFDGGTVVFGIGGDRVVRPAYEIASHTNKAITLVSDMSEAAPGRGLFCTVFTPRRPTLSGFPDGSTPVKDANGNWFVVRADTKALVAAEEATPGVLTEDTTSPPTPRFNFGNASAEIRPQGTWNFSAATVTGGLLGSPTSEQGDMIYRGVDTDTRLAIGTSNATLRVKSGIPAWGKAVEAPDIETDGGLILTADLLTIQVAASSATVAGLQADGTGSYVAAATGSLAGAMVAADKSKLDGIASGADVTSDYLLSSVMTTNGDLLVRSSGGVLSRISPGTSGYPLISFGAGSAPRYWQLGTAGIADAAVDDTKLDNDAVMTASINDLAVTEPKIAAGAVTNSKLGASAVTEAKIAAGAVTEAKIGTGAVTESKIANDSINGEDHIQAGSITGTEIGAGEVGRSALVTNVQPDRYLTMWGRRSGTFTAGQSVRIWCDTTDNFCRMRLNSGETIEIVHFSGSMMAGTTVGTYKFRGGFRYYDDDQLSSGGAYTYLNDEDDWTADEDDHSFYSETWDGTTPLGTLAGAATRSIMVVLENHSSSPGTTISENVYVLLVGRIV